MIHDRAGAARDRHRIVADRCAFRRPASSPPDPSPRCGPHPL